MTEFMDADIQDTLITDDAIITRGQSELCEVTLFAGTADPGKVVVYDGIGTAGTKRFEASSGAKASRQFLFDPPLRFQNGIYLDLTVTAGSCFVRYKAFRE
jgi:hypothetical protein